MAASGRTTPRLFGRMGRAKLSRNPNPYRAAEYAQYRSDEERAIVANKQNEAAALAMVKSRLLGVTVKSCVRLPD